MTVSVCVVAYNEEKFLPNLLGDIKNQTYSHKNTEVVLIDGKSSDKTVEIMEEFKKENTDFYDVKIIENEKRIQAAGWNKAIVNSTGDIIIRIDAHTHVPADFVGKCVKNIKDGENVVGGIRPCVTENESLWGKMLLQAENSLFGSSINKSRRSKQKEYVKTMFHAAYRREVFQKAGGFNENLLRTEDNEIHYRIRKNGYRLCYDPEIVSYQYARGSLRRMIKQKYGNGYWIGLTLGVCPGCISIYHLVPFAFIMGIILTTALALFGLWQLAALMWALYGIFAVTNTVLIITNDKFYPQTLLLPFIFLILHISYGWGTLVGLIKMPFKCKKLRNYEKIECVKDTTVFKK